MAVYRRIFPSFQWEDAWLVNQIVNRPVVMGVHEMGFVNGVPPEEVHASDEAIRRWIRNSMNGCSCLVLFVGEETYKSRWVKFELEEARRLNMGRIAVWLTGMQDRFGRLCGNGPDPYAENGLYSRSPGQGYIIKRYSWLGDNGAQNLGRWIDEAVQRSQQGRRNAM